MKLLILKLARMLGLLGLARLATRGKLKILCYHGIWVGPQPHFGDCLFMAAETFKQRMHWLSRNGYTVLTLEEGLRRLRDGQLGLRDVVITIDDAWYGTWLHMLPTLKSLGFPSTLYVPTSEVVSQEPVYGVFVHYIVSVLRQPEAISGVLPLEHRPDRGDELESKLLKWILSQEDEAARRKCAHQVAAAAGVDGPFLLRNRVFGHMSAAELAEVGDMGVDVQLHTHTHSMHGMNPDGVRREIELNRTWLAEILNRPASSFRHFCYPSGEHQDSVRAVLREFDIASATTTDPGLVDRSDDGLVMRRILDCQSMHVDELNAKLSGLWSLAAAWRSGLRRTQ